MQMLRQYAWELVLLIPIAYFAVIFAVFYAFAILDQFDFWRRYRGARKQHPEETRLDAIEFYVEPSPIPRTRSHG